MHLQTTVSMQTKISVSVPSFGCIGTIPGQKLMKTLQMVNLPIPYKIHRKCGKYGLGLVHTTAKLLGGLPLQSLAS